MPVIRTFVSHHGGEFQDRVAPLLRQVAPLGARPWLDKEDLIGSGGLQLRQALHEGVFGPTCSSLSLFLSKAATTRKWIEQEVLWALERIEERGGRILPVLLDPPGDLDLPEVFVEFMKRREVIWLDPERPDFARRYAASVLEAGGVNKKTEELTLFLGHRYPQWEAVLPPQWEAMPALDLRLDLHGDKDLCPSTQEWQEMERGLETLRGLLPRLTRIQVCGQAPLGLGSLIGKVWDRGAGLYEPIRINAFNFQDRQVWSTASTPPTQDWKPDRATHVRMERPALLRHPALLVVFIRQGKTDLYLPKIQRWNAGRAQAAEVLVAEIPAEINGSEQAQEVAAECVGVLQYLRGQSRHAGVLEVVPTYPLALAPLVTHGVRNLGAIDIYDEVKSANEFRLAVALR